jgi:hypothetical protein
MSVWSLDQGGSVRPQTRFALEVVDTSHLEVFGCFALQSCANVPRPFSNPIEHDFRRGRDEQAVDIALTKAREVESCLAQRLGRNAVRRRDRASGCVLFDHKTAVPEESC